MVSSRARKGRSLGTRINDVDRRVASAEAKARTPDVDAKDIETRLAALEQTSQALMSSSFRSGQDQGVGPGFIVPGAVGAVPRGDTSARDAYYPNPTTDAQRVALANQRPSWYNTDTGKYQTYYAVSGLSGLAVPGLVSGSTSGWYNEPSTEWAGKSGPVSFVSDYKVNWSRGIDSGDTIDATTHASRILIRMTGIYECRSFMRGGTAADYSALSLDGNRVAFEARSNPTSPDPLVGVWTHDHPAGTNNFTSSWYMGTLYAGDFICAGPSNSSSTIALGAAASSGALYVRRIS